MRTTRWERRAPLLTLLLAIGCQAASTTAGDSPAPPEIPVRTSAVRAEATAPPVRATGLISGKEEIRLAFTIGGVVDRVLVDEGAHSRKGQILATLRQDEAASQALQARRALEKADRDLARAEQLHAQGVGALERLQDARTARDVAHASLTAATFHHEHATILAPADGVVLARLAEPSEVIAAGAPVLHFKSSEQGWIVRAGLADRDVVRVRTGDRAEIRTAAQPDRVLAGTVSQIAAAASPMTGTFDVEIAIDPGDAALLSGMHARIEITPSSPDTVFFVPIDAFVEGDGDAGIVFAVAPGTDRARRLPVRMAFLRGGEIALREGLDATVRVVTDGVAHLRDGARVRVLPPEVAEAK